MQYQFLHVEDYSPKGAHKFRSSSRKRSMWDIRDEMIRAPHACPHVADPKEPTVLLGEYPEHAFNLAAERAGDAVDKIGRKLRCDSPVVLVGVVSWAETITELRLDPKKQAEYAFWRTEAIAWLQEYWGDDLKSVVEHLDEVRPHIHFVIVPKLDGARLQIESVHPGKKAAAECKCAGGSRREQKNAYIDAMIDLQDSYYERVSIRCGLTRLGPRRQRLTRKEWLMQQRQAEALAGAYAQLEIIKTKVKARATEFVKQRVAAADDEAQAKVAIVEKHSLQRFESLKQAAQRKITDLRRMAAELEGQLSTKEKLIAAQAEELELLRQTLEDHGIWISRDMAP